MEVKLLSKTSQMPTLGTDGSAGYDLYADKRFLIHSRNQKLIDTGIAMHIPKGFYGRIAPRSGISWKKFTDVGAGVIDSDYRGEIKVMLRNLGDNIVEIKEGERVAQIIITPCITPELKQVEELTETKRGDGGFGSTGKF